MNIQQFRDTAEDAELYYTKYDSVRGEYRKSERITKKEIEDKIKQKLLLTTLTEHSESSIIQKIEEIINRVGIVTKEDRERVDSFLKKHL